MSYDNLPFLKMESPFFQDVKSNPQSFRQEIESSWMKNIDPLLHQAELNNPDFEWALEQQQQPLQRFITEPTRTLFTTGPSINQLNGFSQPFPKSFEPVSALPMDYRARFGSPSTSQELSSDCSSARSPGAEAEWYQEGYYSSQGQDEYTLSHATAHSSQAFSDIWMHPSGSQTLPQSGYPCVNLSDVQGFADPQEITFEADEAYTDMDIRTDFAIQALESRGQKPQAAQAAQYRDEALGTSIRDVASPPQAMSTQASTQDTASISDADIDAEGEIDDEIAMDEATVSTTTEVKTEPQSPPSDDEEYKPRTRHPRNPRKRPSTKATSPPHPKRHRITKPKSTSGGPFTCKLCPQRGFKDNTQLQRHVASEHTRAFVCVFSFAGCGSTFASKNEWKRHVASQHLNLNAWVCTIGSCGKHLALGNGERGGLGLGREIGGRGGVGLGREMGGRGDMVEVAGAEFNRKDLFTQHLRRMHAPIEVKRKNKRCVEWEERVKELQKSCERVRREPPMKLGCAVGGCESKFEGKGCWDERMEHVGKHLERCAGAGAGNGMDGMGSGRDEKDVVRQEGDRLFVEWAEEEGIIEMVGGIWRLCAGGVGMTRGGKDRLGNSGVLVKREMSVDVDVDADGEDEE